MRMIKQLSILGMRLTCVFFSRRLVAKPIMMPIMSDPKNTTKKMPILSNKLKMVSVSADAPWRYFCAVSYKTIATASFSIDSPKMTV